MSRTKQFEIDNVLDISMRLFREKGFSGTSMSMLEKATGLKKPSIYNAFGSKEGLYIASLERFRITYMGKAMDVLDHPDFKSAIFLFCNVMSGGLDSPKTEPFNCVATFSALEMGKTDGLVSEKIKKAMDDMLSRLEARCQKAVEDGQFDYPFTPKDLAALLVAVTRGNIVLGMATGSREAGKKAILTILKLLEINVPE